MHIRVEVAGSTETFNGAQIAATRKTETPQHKKKHRETETPRKSDQFSLTTSTAVTTGLHLRTH